MSLAILSTFFLLLSCITLGAGFAIPSLISDDCYPDVKQVCGGVALSRGDAFAPNSTLRYFVFTRRNPENPQMLHECNGTLPKKTHFNPKRKLIVVIPGFMYGICQLSIFRDIKDEFLEKDDNNVLLIDTRQEYGLDYAEALVKMPSLAKQVANVLQNIQDQTGIKNDKVELIGHSLGAQLCGQISQRFPVHRITGLDPAGIHFTEETHKNMRLDSSDAPLVDVYHCNGGKGLPDFAIDYPAGHADFFINGGALQPSCYDLAVQAMKNLDIVLALAVATGPTVCSHLLCVYYYHLSINNAHGHFKAWECGSYEDFKDGKCAGSEPVIMGYEFERNFTQGLHKKPSQYYFDTSKRFPYVKDD